MEMVRDVYCHMLHKTTCSTEMKIIWIFSVLPSFQSVRCKTKFFNFMHCYHPYYRVFMLCIHTTEYGESGITFHRCIGQINLACFHTDWNKRALYCTIYCICTPVKVCTLKDKPKIFHFETDTSRFMLCIVLTMYYKLWEFVLWYIWKSIQYRPLVLEIFQLQIKDISFLSINCWTKAECCLWEPSLGIIKKPVMDSISPPSPILYLPLPRQNDVTVPLHTVQSRHRTLNQLYMYSC